MAMRPFTLKISAKSIFTIFKLKTITLANVHRKVACFLAKTANETTI